MKIKATGKSALRNDNVGYLYIAPSLIMIIAFALIPICMAAYYSLTKYSVIQEPQWVGLQNYITAFKDPMNKAALKNTIVYTIIVVPGTVICSMLVAALITSRKRTRFTGFVKSAMFIPVISSSVLIGTLWRVIYHNQFGLLNMIIGLFGIPAQNWLGESETALICLAVVGVWKNVGYFLVIYIAAIMDIPKDLYEAASLDGASGVQKFLHITLPMLKPTTVFVMVMSTIWSFQAFELIFQMTGGGPGDSTMTLVYQIYKAAFRGYRMGYACALAMLLFAIILVISMIQRWLVKEE